MLYTLNTIRNKAKDIGYYVQKGFTHYHDVVDYDYNGKRHSGYMVMDLETGFYLPGCYDEMFDFLWELDDVVEFLKKKYEARGRKW